MRPEGTTTVKDSNTEEQASKEANNRTYAKVALQAYGVELPRTAQSLLACLIPALTLRLALAFPSPAQSRVTELTQLQTSWSQEAEEVPDPQLL